MVRLSRATAYILGCTAAVTSISAFHLPSSTTQHYTHISSTSSLYATTVAPPSDTDFKSESAKKQIGNDSFLNQDLMARAQNGPGKQNSEKLKIGIVGAGLA